MNNTEAENYHYFEQREQPKPIISKKSRLAVYAAFYYRLDPSSYNSEEYGIATLDDYLHWYLNQIKEGVPDILDGLPEDCRTAEDCLKEMSDEEIQNLISQWRTNNIKNESYQQECDEYLNYLTVEEKSLGDGHTESSSERNNTEAGFDLKNCEINRTGLPVKLSVKILSPETGKEKIYFINLPEAARAATQEEAEKLVKSLENVLLETKGNLFSRLDARNGKLSVAIGATAKRRTWNIKLAEFNADQLAGIVGSTVEEANKYLSLREKNWDKLGEEEKTFRDEYEKRLKKSEVDSIVQGKKVSFAQKIRDVAVLQEWKNMIGAERYEQLAEEAKNIPIKQEQIDRWEIKANSPEFQAKVKRFFESVKEKFNSWLEALESRDGLPIIAKEVRLRFPEILYALGEEILHNSGRASQWEKYQEMFGLSFSQLIEYARKNNPKIIETNKPRILRAALIDYIKIYPLPSDQWEKSRVSVGRGGKAEEYAFTETYTTSAFPLKSLSDEDLDVIAKEVFGKDF